MVSWRSNFNFRRTLKIKSKVFVQQMILSDPTFAARLVEEVRAHPCLFDIRDPKYRLSECRNQAWSEIITHLNFPGIYKLSSKIVVPLLQTTSTRFTSSGRRFEIATSERRGASIWTGRLVRNYSMKSHFKTDKSFLLGVAFEIAFLTSNFLPKLVCQLIEVVPKEYKIIIWIFWAKKFNIQHSIPSG